MPHSNSGFHAALAKRLPPLVMVAGDEPLLVQEALDATRARAKQEGYGERLSLTVEPGFSWRQVEEQCRAMSLFSARRLIEVHMPKGPNGHRRARSEADGDAAASGGGDDGFKALAALAAEPSPDVLLLLTAGAMDGRERQARWFAALDAAGLVLYAGAVKAEDLPGFVRQRAAAAGLSLTPEAVEALCTRTEGNLLAAAQEIAKLALLHPPGTNGGAPVDAEALAAAVADSSRFEAQSLVEKALAGQAAAALHTLQRLREEGVSPLEIVPMLAWALRSWAQAGAAFAKTRDLGAALQAGNVFGARRALFEAALKRRGFSPSGALVRLAAVDQAVKSGREAWAWEELLTLTLAAAGAARLPAAPTAAVP